MGFLTFAFVVGGLAAFNAEQAISASEAASRAANMQKLMADSNALNKEYQIEVKKNNSMGKMLTTLHTNEAKQLNAGVSLASPSFNAVQRNIYNKGAEGLTNLNKAYKGTELVNKAQRADIDSRLSSMKSNIWVTTIERTAGEAFTIYTGGLAGAGTVALTEADKNQGLQNA